MFLCYIKSKDHTKFLNKEKSLDYCSPRGQEIIIYRIVNCKGEFHLIEQFSLAQNNTKNKTLSIKALCLIPRIMIKIIHLDYC